MIINPNKRVLDYNGQLCRIFERFFDENYDRMDARNGIYDIIVIHREGLQDDFENVKTYINDDSVIIIDTTTESGNLESFLNDLKIKTDGLSNQIYLIVDSDISEYLKHNKVNYKTIQGYEILFYAFTNPASDCFIHVAKSDQHNLINGFISFNGSLRKQRVLFLLELLKRDISINTTSFLFYMSSPEGYMFIRDEYVIMCNDLLNDGLINNQDLSLLLNVNLPIVFDSEIVKDTIIFNKITSYYNQVLNFVNENVTGLVKGDESQYGLITFTEKSLKPFLAHQVPMIFGLKNLNKTLRELGFDLFDDLIPHYLYELIDDPYERLKCMVDILETTLKLDLVEYRKNNTHRFVNNYLKVYELSNKGFDILNDFYKSTIL